VSDGQDTDQELYRKLIQRGSHMIRDGLVSMPLSFSAAPTLSRIACVLSPLGWTAGRYVSKAAPGGLRAAYAPDGILISSSNHFQATGL
jgi:hypothetical protein